MLIYMCVCVSVCICFCIYAYKNDVYVTCILPIGLSIIHYSKAKLL